jgi:hypothetical protein
MRSDKSKIAELQAEWRRAEELNRLADQLQFALIVPSITELGYAGSRIVDALDVGPQDGDRWTLLIDDAISHCRRAQQGAIDVCLAYMRQYVENMVSRFGHSTTLKNNPQLPEFLRQIRETGSLIASARLHVEGREDRYNAVADRLPALIGDFKALSTPALADLRWRWILAVTWSATFAAVAALLAKLVPTLPESAFAAIFSSAAAVVGALAFYFSLASSSRSERSK